MKYVTGSFAESMGQIWICSSMLTSEEEGESKCTEITFDPEADCDLSAGGLALLLGHQRGGADPTLAHRTRRLTGTPLDKGTANPRYWL